MTERGGPVLLVLRALGLGDLLTAVPAVRGLRRSHPEHHLVLAAPRALAPIAALIGGIDEVIDTPGLRAPRIERPEIAVNLHGRGPESHRSLLAVHPGRLITFRNASVPESDGCPPWDPEEHEVLRWCRLLEAHDIPCDVDDLRLRSPGPSEWSGATVIHPGAASGSRRWPAERWAVIARQEFARRPVVITGSQQEAGLAHRVASLAGLPAECVLAGRTDLTALAALVASAKRVISGDTGLAHLAIAYGTPSVTLYGPVPPRLWGPPRGRPQHRVLYKGRRGDPHGPKIDPGLLAIDVAEVDAELSALDNVSDRRSSKS